MLDIKFIRDNAELVEEKAKQKGYSVDIKKLLEVDNQRRELGQKVEALRAERNELNSQSKGAKPSEEAIERGKTLKDQLAQVEDKLKPLDDEYTKLLKQVPNMPEEDVHEGSSEDDNKVVKEWGEKPKFDFEPKTHWEIAEKRNLIDKGRAAKVTGARFAYIKGDLVKLQFAIVQFVLDTLTDEKVLQKIITDNNLKVSSKVFTPVLPPAMLKTEVFEAMDRLDPRDDRYKVGEAEDDLWLQGSAEHTIGPMYKDEIIGAQDLPIRYIGYSPSFRREAGTYGKDTEGIIRMHQFDKLEMEVFSDAESGRAEHDFLIAVQEYLMQQLKIPYQLIDKCTFDIGKPNARGVDINAWMPGQDRFRETHTADFMRDYQARRLMTRYKNDQGQINFVHTNDATAFALGRTMVAIIENYQKKDGSVTVPEALRGYMGGQASL